MKKNIYPPAFTVTELLISITILLILSGIAIVSYGSYTSSTRDSKRVYNINQILSSLNQYKIGETLETPSQYISYTQSGTLFAIQGQLDETYLSKIHFFGDVEDETLNILPSLLLSFPKQDFQIMTFFENTHQDYSAFESLSHGRFPGIFGAQLGILLDTRSFLPLETSFAAGESLDIASQLPFLSRSFLNNQAYLDTQDISFLPHLTKNSGKGWILQGNSFLCQGELCMSD